MTPRIQGARRPPGPDLARIPESQLFKSRLRNLGLRLEGSWAEPLIQQVRRELRARGLDFQPHFWLSDEWFCPDGVPGVAIPFYLMHPRLARLERLRVGRVEGYGRESFLKILRHEVGHAIDNAYGLRSHPLRERVFGSSRRTYPRFYKPQLYSRRFVRHLGDGYAQSHPDEDFAETVAVWLTPGLNWRRRYQGQPALIKLLAVDTMMKEIRGRKPILKNRWRVDPLDSDSRTLREYHRTRRRQLGAARLQAWDPVFRRLGANKEGDLPAGRVLAELSRPAVRTLTDQSGSRLYEIRSLMRQMVRRAEELNLRFERGKLRPKRVVETLSRHALTLVRQGAFRIYL